ncbi:MAG: tetratricopeptide repeat protein [Desulfatibacillaceae bacterium]|nr:tetratricopeptide repeat protein [Desulfatibacillaceae bacterium]
MYAYMVPSLVAVAALFGLFLLTRLALGGVPLLISVRVFYAMAMLPVAAITASAMWRHLAGPRLVAPESFFAFAALACGVVLAVISRRSGSYYILGIPSQDFFDSLHKTLKHKGLSYEENLPDLKIKDGPLLFVEAFEGQDTGHIGAQAGQDKKIVKEIAQGIIGRFSVSGQKPGTPPLLAVFLFLCLGAALWSHIQISSVNSGFYLDQGHKHIQEGQYETALKAFEMAWKQDTGNPVALMWQGVALAHLGRHALAEASMREAARLDPTDCEIMTNLARLKATASDQKILDAQEALALMQRASFCPQTAFFLDTKAAVLARAGDFEQAARVQQEAIELLKTMNAGKELMEQVQHRLSLYEAGLAWSQ